MRRRGLAAHVVDDQRVAGLDEVEGHRPPHVPEPDESDPHGVLPRSVLFPPAGAVDSWGQAQNTSSPPASNCGPGPGPGSTSSRGTPAKTNRPPLRRRDQIDLPHPQMVIIPVRLYFLPCSPASSGAVVSERCHDEGVTMGRWLVVLGLAALSMSAATPAEATHYPDALNLTDLVEKAERIFLGKVL